MPLIERVVCFDHTEMLTVDVHVTAVEQKGTGWDRFKLWSVPFLLYLWPAGWQQQHPQFIETRDNEFHLCVFMILPDITHMKTFCSVINIGNSMNIFLAVIMLVYVYSAAWLQVCWHLQEAGINA